MEQLRETLERYLDAGLEQAVLSGVRHAGEISKARIRPVWIRERLLFQVAKTQGTKELHENLEKEAAIAYIIGAMARDFKQMQLVSEKGQVSLLVSKKGKMTLKEKRRPASPARPAGEGEREESRESGMAAPVWTAPQDVFLTEARRRELSHNRKKRYILEEGRPVEFLVDLGVMTPDGRVVRARYDKFRQINRFLEFIEDILPKLPADREISILDFGCGKSYLTFAVYYYLHELKNRDVRIVGLDLKEDVIARCSRLAEKYRYEKLTFLAGDVASYQGAGTVDMVVTLHACDTATDYALARAVEWGASVILSVPCCQHELNRQIQSEDLAPVLHYGIIRERMAALVTDGLRAGFLERAGYEAQVLEFIDMEHTPKNLLIRAVYTGLRKDNGAALARCMETLHLDPTLARLLGGGERS